MKKRPLLFLYIAVLILALGAVLASPAEGGTLVIEEEAPATRTPRPTPNVGGQTVAPGGHTPKPTRTPKPTATPKPTPVPTPEPTPTQPPVIIEAGPAEGGAPTPAAAPAATETPAPAGPTPTPAPVIVEVEGPDRSTQLAAVRTQVPGPTVYTEYPLVINHVTHPDRWTDFALERGAEQLEVIFPPQRDCDAILIRCGGETMLIDCASHEFDAALVTALRYLGVRRLDRVLITHPHHDHVEGFPLLCEHFAIGELLVCFPEDYNEHMPKLYAWAEQYGIPVRQYADGDVFRVGGAELEAILRCPEDYPCNDRSAQLMLRFGERTMLFTADLEKAGMRYLAEHCAPGELKAEIIKYPHHGKSPLVTAFKEAVDPVFAVVTQRERGWDGQLYLRNVRIPYINTRAYGIRLRTDGRHWLAEHMYPVGDPRGQ